MFLSRATGKVWKIANSAASRSEEMNELRNIAENSRLILSICSEQEIEPIHESSTNLVREREREKLREKELKGFIFTCYTCTKQLTRMGKKALCFKDLLYRVTYTPLHILNASMK